MNGNFNWKDYQPSPLLKAIQIFLLILIIIGIGLLATQKMWVPKVVEYILGKEAFIESPTPVLVPEISNPNKAEVKPTKQLQDQVDTSQMETNRKGYYLSEDQIYTIAKAVITQNLRNETNFECLSIQNENQDDYRIYTSRRVFSASCPGDETSTPAIPAFRVNRIDGSVTVMSLDGIYRPL